MMMAIPSIIGGIVMQEDEQGNLIPHHITGSAQDARNKVRAYFDDLRETANRQEEAGLAVVNNYVQEKLLSLRQQQEDMAVLMSQVTSVCMECERSLKRSDAEVTRTFCSNYASQFNLYFKECLIVNEISIHFSLCLYPL